MARDSGNDRGWKWWLSHVGVPLLAPLVAAVVIFLLTHGGGGEPRGAITFPKDGSEVPRAFTAEGTLTDIADDEHLWLVAQSDGLLFPKEPEIDPQPHWIMQSLETGVPAGGRFSLILLMVGSEGQRQIQAWLTGGEATTAYPGLKQIVNSQKLDTATELALPKKAPEP